MDVCGPNNDKWTKDRVQQKIDEEMGQGAFFVLPIATIIETGNHISKATHGRKERAEALSDILRKSADGSSPWAAFSAQNDLWEKDKLKNLLLIGRIWRFRDYLLATLPLKMLRNTMPK